MKRVLFLVNHDIVIYNFRRELVQELLNQGHEVYISSPFGDRISLLEKLGAKFIETKIDRRGTNPLNDYKLLRTYKRIMKDIRPDVVLTYTIKPNIYGGIAAGSLKIPYIANITGLGTAVEKKSLLQKITTMLYKKAFKNVNTVFFQNQENMDYFIKQKIALGKHELIPGSGVNLEHFKLMPYPSDEIIRFVFIGRIMKEKGIEYYLEAARVLKKKYDNLEFHVCGFLEENYKDIINELVSNNTIIYHGLVDDIRLILKDMHAIIHPTYYPEGISNVLLEAAAMGRPAIATNRSGCKEVIDHGITGYLFEAKNQNQLNNQVENFINTSNEFNMIMGLKAREKIEKEFNRTTVVNQYMYKINGL